MSSTATHQARYERCLTIDAYCSCRLPCLICLIPSRSVALWVIERLYLSW